MTDSEPATPAGTAALSMRAALDLFVASPDIELRRKRLISADVRAAIAKHPGLGLVDANGRAARPYMDKMAHEKRDRNIRSNIRNLLKWVMAAVPPDRRQTSLSSEWAELLASSNLEKHDAAKISRFGRYCSGLGIPPDQVSDVVVQQYINRIAELGSVRNVALHRKELVRTWNGCVARVAGWPSIKLSRLRSFKTLKCPRLEDLKSPLIGQITTCFESLQQTRSSLEDGKGKRFDRRLPSEGGPATKKKVLLATSAASYERYVRRGLRILAENLHIPYEDMNLRMLVDTENVETILNVLAEELEEADKGNRSLHLMGCALKCLAKNYFKISEHDLLVINHMQGQIEKFEAKLTLKNIGRLRAIFMGNRHKLLRLPAKLINGALQRIRLGCARPQDLVDAKIGVAIAILLNIPLRKANLVALGIGVNIKLPAKAGYEGRLFIPGKEVKNGEDIDRPIPIDLLNLLLTYIKEILPLLCKNNTSLSLFPGVLGDAHQSPEGFGTCMSGRIAKYLGIEINPHLFRHFAAIAYLEDHPGEYEVVRLLLGNRDLEIIKQFYTGIEKDAALRKVDSALAVHKRNAGLSPTNMLKLTKPVKRRLRRSK